MLNLACTAWELNIDVLNSSKRVIGFGDDELEVMGVESFAQLKVDLAEFVFLVFNAFNYRFL